MGQFAPIGESGLPASAGDGFRDEKRPNNGLAASLVNLRGRAERMRVSLGLAPPAADEIFAAYMTVLIQSYARGLALGARGDHVAAAT